MGAEVGATTSTFPYTPNMRAYLHATARGPVANAADEAASKGFLSADEGAEYDEVINIVSNLFEHPFCNRLNLLPRIYPSWSLLLTGHSHLTWLRLYRNSGHSSRSKVGRINFLRGSLGLAQTALTKTW